jgi:hypothetical protein
MMTPARMKELLNRKPFRPIRLFLSDGSHHDVPHPEFAWVFGGRIFIGEPANGSLEGDGPLKELSILHVTRVEELRPHKSKK